MFWEVGDAKCWFYTVFSKVGEAKCWFYTVFSKVGEAKSWFSIGFLKKMNDLRPSGRPGPERPNFSKTAGCKKPYKILCKIAPQTRFRASGSPGTVFEVPGGRSQRRRKAILTRLSAKTAPDLAKRTKLSAKTAIGDAKPTIPYERDSKSSHGKGRRRAKNIRFWPDCHEKDEKRSKTGDAVWNDSLSKKLTFWHKAT